MNNYFFYLLLLFSIICSCSNDFDIEQDDYMFESIDCVEEQSISTVSFSFDSITAHSNWIKYTSFQQMVDACQITDSLLPKLSTKQLVKLCATHPLNLSYTFFSNKMEGAKIIIDGFNGFKELVTREDATDELLSFYNSLNLSTLKIENGRITFHSDDNFDFNLYTLGLTELFIKSNYFDVSSLKNANRLEDILSVKLMQTSMLPDDLMIYLNNNLYAVNNVISNHKANKSMQTRDLVNITSTDTTKGGWVVEAVLFTEMPQSVIDDKNYSVASCYPLATMLAPSSQIYNCHNYAWVFTEGRSYYWLNKRTIDGYQNLSKFWINDWFSNVATESQATKVVYTASNDLTLDNIIHSAVVSTTVPGKYESKWDDGPLMRHDPDYCPYSYGTYKKFFNHVAPTPVIGSLLPSYGTGTVNVNTTAYYLPYNQGDGFSSMVGRVEVSLENAKGEDVLSEGIAYYTHEGRRSAKVYLTITQPGLYNLEIRYYNIFNEYMGAFGFQPIVI